MINRAQMVALLIAEFPDIEDDITDETWVGLTHLEVSSFRRYTQAQIDDRNEAELERCFRVARKLMMDGDGEIENAMHVSYLEHLNLRDGKAPRSWAIALMPEPLQAGYQSIQASHA